VSDNAERMLRACLEGLSEEDRRVISVDMLQRIVKICDGAIPTAEAIPELQHIRAFTLRIGDLVWNPNTSTFLTVRTIEDNGELQRIEYADQSATWCAPDDMFQVPVHRVLACEWADRRRTARSSN
jgi:hypothetical protein